MILNNLIGPDGSCLEGNIQYKLVAKLWCILPFRRLLFSGYVVILIEEI